MDSASANCVFCSKVCTPRQHSLQCDKCDGWQHRICRTGITQAFYRQLVKGEVSLPDWRCFRCTTEARNQATAILNDERDGIGSTPTINLLPTIPDRPTSTRSPPPEPSHDLPPRSPQPSLSLPSLPPGLSPHLPSPPPGLSPYLPSPPPGLSQYLPSAPPGLNPYLPSPPPGLSPHLPSPPPGSSPYVPSPPPGLSPYLPSPPPGLSHELPSPPPGLSHDLPSPPPGLSPYLPSPPPGLSPHLPSPAPGLSPYLPFPPPGLSHDLPSPPPGLSQYLPSAPPRLSPDLPSPPPGLSPHLPSPPPGSSPYVPSPPPGLSPYLPSPPPGLSHELPSPPPGLSHDLPSPPPGLSYDLPSPPPGLSHGLPSPPPGLSPQSSASSDFWPSPPPPLSLEYLKPNPMNESVTEQFEEIERDDPQTSTPVVYTVVEKGTLQGKPRLTDNRGFTFCINTRRGSKTYWRCSVRSKANTCHAVVTQEGSSFYPGRKAHNHEGKWGADVRTAFMSELKQQASQDMFVSAAKLVEDNLQDLGLQGQACLPSVRNMAKVANYHRQTLRPCEPKDITFEINSGHIPHGFLIADETVKGQRHLAFATANQLNLLAAARVWYLDGTFHVVRKPFVQLYSLHCFLRSSDGNIKQVPVTFIFMSKRRQVDYEKVLQVLVTKLGGLERLRVERVVADFEVALWQAVRRVFPGRVELKGCGFHWAQAIFRKVQAFGLEPEYHPGTPIYGTVKRLMALPYLHQRHIFSEFTNIQTHRSVVESQGLTRLMDYVDKTWMKSTVWPISSWSIYGLDIRTNNDCEGWHRRLNDRAGKKNLQFYLLVDLLHKEATSLERMLAMVENGQLCRVQTKKTKDFNAGIQAIWSRFQAGDANPTETLSAVARLLMK